MNPPLNHPLEWILSTVEKPSRYVGGEWNAVVKDPARIRLRVALAFPDLYELGLGNLGLQILYAILNAREEIWAERVCLPAPDLSARLRETGQPLFLLEIKPRQVAVMLLRNGICLEYIVLQLLLRVAGI